MRKFLISILLAGAAATPALAGPHNWPGNDQQTRQDRQQAREDRQQVREDRQQAREDSHQDRSDARSERQQMRFDRSSGQAAQFNGSQGGRFSGSQDGQFGGFTRPERMDAPRQTFGDRYQRGTDPRAGDDYVAPGPRMVTPNSRPRNLGDMQQQRIERRELRQSNRDEPRVVRTRPPVVSEVPRPGTQPPLRTEGYRHQTSNWNTGWRHDGRYDWRNYRNRHRSIFHLGFYYDPYGWGYQPYSIGWRLWPAYYGRSFWIQDPWMYRLPYAPPGYVWVRYWNDALLVDTWSGEVVDMIPGFFW